MAIDQGEIRSTEAQGTKRYEADVPSAIRRSYDRFALSLQVAVAIAIIICGTMGALGFWLTTYATEAEIDNTADQSAFYMNMLLVPALRGVERDGPVPADVEQRLDETVNILPSRPIPTAVVWWPDTTVAYSTDKSIMGQKIHSDHLEAAFAGGVIAHLEGGLTDHGVERQEAMGRPLLEVYAPLRDTDTGAIFAVGEFYQDASRLVADIRRLNLTIWLTVAVATALMLSLLGVVATRARTTVELHRSELSHRLDEAQRLAVENARLLDAAEKGKVDAFQINEDMLNKIGADIHDGPLQLLGLIMLRLEGINARSKTLLDAPAERAKTIELASRTVQELRDLTAGLTLPELRGLDMEETVRLAAARHESNTGTTVELQIGELPDTAPTPVKTCVYRVVQEALNNAFWHADGAGQRVSAALSEGQIEITVRDAGRGILAALPKPGGRGLGLSGLGRRVEAFGGTIAISAEPEGGTRVTARIPLGADDSGIDTDDL